MIFRKQGAKGRCSSFVTAIAVVIVALVIWAVRFGFRVEATAVRIDIVDTISEELGLPFVPVQVADLARASEGFFPAAVDSALPEDLPDCYPFDEWRKVSRFEFRSGHYEIGDREAAKRSLSHARDVNPNSRVIGDRELEQIHLACASAHDAFLESKRRYFELQDAWQSKCALDGAGVVAERFASECDAQAYLDTQFGRKEPGKWRRITTVFEAYEGQAEVWRAASADPLEEIGLYRARHEMSVLRALFTFRIFVAIARLAPS